MRRGYLFLLLLGTCMAFWYGSATDALIYPYQSDSSYYIECARTLLESGVLQPDRLYPPGYPLLISAVAALGLEPAKAALWLVRIGYALLPMLLAWALRGLIGIRSAVMVAVLAVLSPGVWEIASKAGADIPFLVLVVSGFALLMRSGAAFNPVEALVSGVLLGAAYLVRNTGVAVFAAVAAALGAGAVFRWLPRERLFAVAGSFAIGAALPVVPLLLWNYFEFGQLQPYSMPASNIGLITNIRVYVDQAVVDLVASNRIAKYVGWDFRLLLGAGIGFAALLTVGIKTQWPKLDNGEKFALALLGSYVAAGAGMVILARTLYQWGEYINLRHVAQYSWAIFAVAPLLLGWCHQGAPSKRTRVAVAVAAAALIGGRVLYLSTQYHRNSAMHRALAVTTDPVSAVSALYDKSLVWTGPLKRRIADNRKLMSEIEGMPAGTVLASNVPDVLRIETGRAVQRLEFDNADQMADQLVKLRGIPRSGLPAYAFIFPTNDLLRNGQWVARFARPNVPGYEIVTAGRDLVWLRSDRG
jgi:hypothetical protein